MLIACVNQDRGVRVGGDKGAAVHVEAMRRAFAAAGARVLTIDAKEPPQVAAELERADPVDAVYERYALGAEVAGRFATERGIPHLLEVNAPLLDEAALHRGLQVGDAERARERAILSRATRLVAVSDPVAVWLASEGVDPTRILVRPNGVDGERFHPGLRRPRRDGRFVLGFHGRLRPWHRFDDLVTVFARLLARGLPVRLSVVGKGEYAAALAGRVPDDAWHVLPWTPHDAVGSLVAGFDALALTHRPDGPCYFSPLKLLEAMAVGAVPVVPAVGDLPSVVSHGVTGLVYPEGDLDALEDALAALVLDRERAARLGRAAATHAARHTWVSLARELLALVALVPPTRSAAP